MIKLLLLAVIPFMTEHRNIAPKTEISTNFYGSVTGIVDNAYIQAHGGGGGGGDVRSVNGKIGDVTLSAEDVGAVPSVVTNEVRVQLAEKLDIVPNGTTNGIRIAVNGNEMSANIDSNVNIKVGGNRSFGDYGITNNPVMSVNDKTGDVQLTPEDIGAASESQLNDKRDKLDRKVWVLNYTDWVITGCQNRWQTEDKYLHPEITSQTGDSITIHWLYSHTYSHTPEDLYWDGTISCPMEATNYTAQIDDGGWPIGNITFVREKGEGYKDSGKTLIDNVQLTDGLATKQNILSFQYKGADTDTFAIGAGAGNAYAWNATNLFNVSVNRGYDAVTSIVISHKYQSGNTLTVTLNSSNNFDASTTMYGDRLEGFWYYDGISKQKWLVIRSSDDSNGINVMLPDAGYGSKLITIPDRIQEDVFPFGCVPVTSYAMSKYLNFLFASGTVTVPPTRKVNGQTLDKDITIEGMTDNALVWIGNQVKTKSGTVISVAMQSWVEAKNYATQAWVNAKNYATQAWVEAKGYATQAWVEAKNYATQSQLAETTAIVYTWEEFLDGSNVVFSITNYISGTYNLDAAKLRIMEMRNGEYREVYNSREEIILHLDDFSNRYVRVALDAIADEVARKLANKADKDWGKYTSAGGIAPSNTVYMTAPNTVFAGGMEYERVAVGEGTICVLTTKGAPVWTVGDEGTFKFQDDGGTNYFGFAKSDSYTIGCNCDGIQVGGDNHVRLQFDITMSGVPCIWYKPTLENYASTEWEQLNLPDGTPVSGASHLVVWEQNPDPGTQVCYLNVQGEPSGFFRATVEVAGSAKFMTNMPADFSGGIQCSDDSTKKVKINWNNGSPVLAPVD